MSSPLKPHPYGKRQTARPIKPVVRPAGGRKWAARKTIMVLIGVSMLLWAIIAGAAYLIARIIN
nr:hypothetical protein [uncultured Brevundimonas sp.]